MFHVMCQAITHHHLTNAGLFLIEPLGRIFSKIWKKKNTTIFIQESYLE